MMSAGHARFEACSWRRTRTGVVPAMRRSEWRSAGAGAASAEGREQRERRDEEHRAERPGLPAGLREHDEAGTVQRVDQY